MHLIRILCPQDKTPLHIREDMLGREIVCPHCKTRFTAKTPSTNEVPAPTRTPVPLGWGDFLLFVGTGILLVVALVWWLLQTCFGIDFLA